MSADILPGMRVRLPARPDWGIGQVQSVAGDRVTVNFEHGGKVILRLPGAQLEPVGDDPA
jgi:FKBP-type peptidyl-prolyl cis-trans isomerase 2